MTREILASKRAMVSAALATSAGKALADDGSTTFIGLGAGAVPVHEGSREYRALPAPLMNDESGSFFIFPRAGLPTPGPKWIWLPSGPSARSPAWRWGEKPMIPTAPKAWMTSTSMAPTALA